MTAAQNGSAPSWWRPVVALAGACHPAPTLAVTIVTALLGTGVGLSGAHVMVLTAAVLTGQLSIGWSNDGIDAARDRRSGRRDKPVAAGRVPLRLLGIATALAVIATIGLSIDLGAPAAAAALTLVAAGWAYNLGLKSSVLSAAAYLIGFAALPAAPYLALPGHPLPPWWAPVAGGLLGVAAHFANVLPDLREDEQAGVRGLPHRLGARTGALVLAAALAAATLVLGLGPDGRVALAGIGTALGLVAAASAAVLAARNPDSQAAFRVTLLTALLDVVLLVTRTR